jgi:cyclopropane-fatty-acyl-phospholipid synthase
MTARDPWYLTLAASGFVPDRLVRAAVRSRSRRRIAANRAGSVEAASERMRSLMAALADAPITIATGAANEQHYEVPAAFYDLLLGPRRKYSSCWWPDGVDTLAAAELAMLDRYVREARLEDGQDILDLGCGWGSLTLHLAERFPNARVLGVSNSASQRIAIEKAAADRGLANVQVVTADVATFDPALLTPARRFDRIVSIEMLEHVRNHQALFARVAEWLRDDGLFFVHVFSHRTEAWLFDADDPQDWIGRWFFTGGMMPSDDLFLHHQRDLVCLDHWRIGGEHYARTLEAWLTNLDADHRRARGVLEEVHGRHGRRALHRWRLFLLVSAEVWGLDGGHEFLVSHYLFAPRR